jgi:hypothetical protein
LANPEEYKRKYPGRELAHWLLQTEDVFQARPENIKKVAHVAPTTFWESCNARAQGFCLIGHVQSTPGRDTVTLRQLWTSALERHVWAERLCGGAELSVRMVRANIQYRLSLFLEGRARADKAGTCDALSLDNVPAHFPYVVFGHDWVAQHEQLCTYSVSTGVHQFAGTCADMVPLTGTSCKTTCVGLNGSGDADTADGLLVVQPASTLAELTLRWTPKRPGVLLLIFGGFAFYGPPVAEGGRGDPLWSTTRNSRAVAQRAAALPGAGIV